MASELTPLISKHNSLSELSLEAIHEKFLSGHFKTGDWLRQEQFSQQLVSATRLCEKPWMGLQ
jgi:hypothetical protein